MMNAVNPRAIAAFYGLFCIFYISCVASSCAKTVNAMNYELLTKSDIHVTPAKYRIGRDDKLAVYVKEQKDLSAEYVVSSVGTITLPFVGIVEVKDLTTQQLAAKLKTALNQYVKDPEISVTISQIANFRVLFAGQFNRPGELMLPLETTLLRGVLLAGGLGNFASGRIIIMRKNPKDTLSRYAFEWDDIINGNNKFDQFYVTNNDIIYAE